MAEKIEIQIVTESAGATTDLKTINTSIGNIVKTAGGLIAAKVGFDAVKSGITGAIGNASDLAESQQKVNTVFGDSAKIVSDFASGAAKNLGSSKEEALAAAGTFGNLFTAMGLGQEDAAGLSTNLLTLGADLASFNNIDTTDALDKLRAGLVGEAEPLRALGVNMNAAAVEAKAMELGLVGANGEISEAAKIQARYAIIMDQTKTAQGDFARNADGLANSQKTLNATLTDLSGTLGTALLPVITPLVQMLTSVVNVFTSLPGPVQMVAVALGGIIAVGAPLLAILGPVIAGFSAALPVLGAVAAVLTGPVALAIGAVVLVIAGLYLAWKTNFLGIQDITQSVIDFIAPYITSGIDGIKSGIETALGVISDIWGTVWPAIQTVIETVWPIIQTVVSTYIAIVQTAIETALGVISGIWNTVWPAVQAVIDTVWPIISAVVSSHIQAAQAAIETALGIIKALWDTVWPAVQAVIETVWPIIEAVVSDTIARTRQNIETALTIIQTIWDTVWNGLNEVVSTAWGNVESTVQGGIDTVRGMFDGALGWLESAGRDIIQGLINGLTGMAKPLTDAVGGVIGALGPLANKLLEIGSPSKVFHEIGMNIMRGLVGGIDELGPDAASALDRYIESVISTADPLNDWLTHLPEAARQSVSEFGKVLADLRTSPQYMSDDIVFDPKVFAEHARSVALTWADEMGYTLSQPQTWPANALEGAGEMIANGLARHIRRSTAIQEAVVATVQEAAAAIAPAPLYGGPSYSVSGPDQGGVTPGNEFDLTGMPGNASGIPLGSRSGRTTNVTMNVDGRTWARSTVNHLSHDIDMTLLPARGF